MGETRDERGVGEGVCCCCFAMGTTTEGGEGVGRDESNKESQQAAQALERVTDHVEERQLDENKVNKAMVALAEADKANREAQRKREKELAAVKIDAEDVEVIANEFAVDKKAAELRLRERKGDLEAALKSYFD